MTGSEGRSFTRRRLLGIAGVGATIAAAGCLGDGFGTGDGDNRESGGGSGDDEH